MTRQRRTDPGAVVVDLPAGCRCPQAVAPEADLVLMLLRGMVEVRPLGRLEREVPVLVGRSTPWRLDCPGPSPARLLVVSAPSGPERLVEAMVARPAYDLAELVAIATENGVVLRAERDADGAAGAGR